MKIKKSAVTLLELILAIAFLSVIVLGTNSIYYFSHFQTVNTDRRAWLQNQLVVLTEHMRREISKAIGNEIIYTPADTVIDTSNISGDSAIKVFIDGNGNGQRDTDGSDYWIAYRFTGASGPNKNQIWYCPQCENKPCANCNTYSWNPPPPPSENVIAKRITAFNLGSIVAGVFSLGKPVNAMGQLNDNSIAVRITACWNPTVAESVDNPCLTTTTLITMPSVTAH